MNNNYLINKNINLSKENNFNFTFLDNYKEYFNIKVYYNIYNSLDNTKIKNLYNFIYIKSYLIKNKLNLNNFELKKQIIDKPEKLDEIFNKFNHDNDISKIIFIINSTLRYI